MIKNEIGSTDFYFKYKFYHDKGVDKLLRGQIRTEILRTKDGIVRLCEDTVTDSYSIGLRTREGMCWKYISKELHDLLIEELSEYEGVVHQK